MGDPGVPRVLPVVFEDQVCDHPPFLGDLLGHDIHVEHPEWSMRQEISPDKAAAVRREVVEAAARDDTLLHAYHFPFPGLGRVVREKEGLRWQTEPVTAGL